jgi:hypothetical protein
MSLCSGFQALYSLGEVAGPCFVLMQMSQRFSFEVIKQLNSDKRNVFLVRKEVVYYACKLTEQSNLFQHEFCCVLKHLPWCKVSLEKFIVTQLVKKFSLSTNQPCLKDPETEIYRDTVYSVPYVMHCFSMVHFNIFLPIKHFPKWYHPSRFLDKNLYPFIYISYACYVLCTSHSPWFHHTNYIWRKRKIVKTLVI